jgi:phosphoribosyl 1,2-cyclic phosphodiesterase
VNVTLWGTRGSLAAPGPETMHYGGNTSCVEVRCGETALVLDAGTGVRRLGESIARDTRRVDVLLTHLHMDHIQGLGFFEPFFRPNIDVHLWGPSSTQLDLHARLSRYLSPPLFPVRLRDLACELTLHDVVSVGSFEIGPFSIEAELVCHPGPTVGYRIEENGASLVYLPDHEPALGADDFPGDPDYISGLGLARDADLLIHDTMFTAEEYPRYIGWGHPFLEQTLAFARAAGVKRLVTFHHDPSHTDAELERQYEEASAGAWPFELLRGLEEATFEVA